MRLPGRQVLSSLYGREDAGHVIRIPEFAAAVLALVHLSYFPRLGRGRLRSLQSAEAAALSAISPSLSAARCNGHAALRGRQRL